MFTNASGRHYRRGENPYRQHFYQRARAPDRSGNDQLLGQLMQILPLLLLFLFSFMSGSGSDATPFNMSMTREFSVKRTTPTNIEYFVRPTFLRQYGRDARSLFYVESLVEKTHLETLQRTCNKEKTEKANLEKAAKGASGGKQEALLKKLFAFKFDACDRLEEFTMA